MTKFSKIIFGGAGPKVNADRRYLIDQIKTNLEMWRDFDNLAYLEKARELMESAE